jgi:hypothetical protein
MLGKTFPEKHTSLRQHTGLDCCNDVLKPSNTLESCGPGVVRGADSHPFAAQVFHEDTTRNVFSIDTARTAAMYAGAAAVGAFAFYKRPRLVRNFGAGALLTGGTLQLGLAAMTAKWAQFGAYLDEATRVELNDSQEAVMAMPSHVAEN